MITGENKTNRDYKQEHEARKKSKKRLLADIERKKALKFEALLHAQNITYSEWLNKKISDHINEA